MQTTHYEKQKHKIIDFIQTDKVCSYPEICFFPPQIYFRKLLCMIWDEENKDARTD